MSKTSPIDAHARLLGVASDAEIATLAGVSVSAVYQYRRHRGIGVARRATANALGRAATSTSRTGMTSRKAPPKIASNGKTPRKRSSKLDGFVALLGVLPDAEVARRAGITREGVRQYRLRRGLTSARAGNEPAAIVVAPTPSSEQRHCWRVSLLDGGSTHLAATSADEAARLAHDALADRAVGIERLGLMYP